MTENNETPKESINYVIEGTVTEISDDGSFKLAGSEGYAIKQGEKKYNVLCPNNMDTSCLQSYILSSSFKFKTNGKQKFIAIQAVTHRTLVKVELVINVKNQSEAVISSISLLSE